MSESHAQPRRGSHACTCAPARGPAHRARQSRGPVPPRRLAWHRLAFPPSLGAHPVPHDSLSPRVRSPHPRKWTGAGSKTRARACGTRRRPGGRCAAAATRRPLPFCKGSEWKKETRAAGMPRARGPVRPALRARAAAARRPAAAGRAALGEYGGTPPRRPGGRPSLSGQRRGPAFGPPSNPPCAHRLHTCPQPNLLAWRRRRPPPPRLRRPPAHRWPLARARATPPPRRPEAPRCCTGRARAPPGAARRPGPSKPPHLRPFECRGTPEARRLGAPPPIAAACACRHHSAPPGSNTEALHTGACTRAGQPPHKAAAASHGCGQSRRLGRAGVQQRTRGIWSGLAGGGRCCWGLAVAQRRGGRCDGDQGGAARRSDRSMFAMTQSLAAAVLGMAKGAERGATRRRRRRQR